MKIWQIAAINEATKMDIASALITLLCVVIVVVSIEFSAPIIAGAAAVGAAATGVWRAHVSHEKPGA
jgi:hypothetical protein